ncbi:unnamed protein product [Mytilus coruscus]|uniref:Uncharacterized protein n=1 Tax=Mytilus coruscus TaxID=42192 RepID=A0A6J8C4F7_MYTCO|nr:unnamed protein product [Mytilus coruscus]
MTLSYKKRDLKFRNKGYIKNIGSIEEVSEICCIQNSLVKPKQAQVQPARVESMLAFKLEILEKFNHGKFIAGVAVTEDNSLFLCDFQKIRDNLYVFKINPPNLTYRQTLSLPSAPYGLSVLTGTDKAIVTLPKSHLVGQKCYGITTTGDYIAVGKTSEIKILKSNGECIRTIVIADLSRYISFLHYNHNDDSIIYRTLGMVNRIQLDGTLLYSYAVPGEGGIAVDKQGHVYMSKCFKSEIQRLLPDWRDHDVVMRIKTPFAVAFNESCTKFAVTNITGLVQIYSCK